MSIIVFGRYIHLFPEKRKNDVDGNFVYYRGCAGVLHGTLDRLIYICWIIASSINEILLVHFGKNANRGPDGSSIYL